MRSDIFKEKSPLSNQDCFVVFDRRKTSFTFPVHVHPECELNYVHGALGAKRIVGDSTETIGNHDLVLITNPDLKHAWMDGEGGHKDIHEITIQFHPSLMAETLDKRQFQSIQQLFSRATKGIVFGEETVQQILPLLRILTLEQDGFYSVMKLYIILYELSKRNDFRILSKSEKSTLNHNDRMMQLLQEFVSENIYRELNQPLVASALNMSKSTFSRFLKSTTQMNFTDYLLDFRINMAMRMLKEELPISDVVGECGFNSVSYFYRVFKKMKGLTPVEYRNLYKKQQIIV